MDGSVISVRQLSKQFGQHEALKQVSFSVAPGDVFGYLGPNGAGKTTTVRILLGLIRPTSGCVHMFGQDILQDDSSIRQRLGIVLDHPGLYDRMTAYDNLLFYARLYQIPRTEWGTRVENALKQVKLSRDSQRQVATFSKGMKQRLAIARALLHKPEILFLDEPTSGLDPEGQREIRELLLSLSNTGRHTVFLCSHNLDEVQKICNKVAIIKEGRLLLNETIATLRHRFTTPVVKVIFSDNPQDEQLDQALQSLNFVNSWHWNGEGLNIEVTDESCASNLLQHLVSKELSVAESTIVRQSLEDVYLSIIQESSS